MEKESFILSKLPFSVHKNDVISTHILSSFIYILRITPEKNVFVYMYNKRRSGKGTFQLIWHDAALFVDSILISSDGYICALSLDNVFHFYSILEKEVFQESELQLPGFLELVKYTDLPVKYDVLRPLVLVERNLVLCADDRWLINLNWNEPPKQPALVYCSDLGININSVTYNQHFIFSLNSAGELFIHRTIDGSFFYKLDVCNWLPRRENYRLLDLNQDKGLLIALVDSANFVYIFDISSEFDDKRNLGLDSCSSVSSEKSYKTTTSSYSTVSRASSVSGVTAVSSVSNVKQHYLKFTGADAVWNSYLNNLKIFGKDYNQDGSSFSDREITRSLVKLELEATDLINIKKVHVTDRGISVSWTVTSTSGTSYRLFDGRTNQQIFTASLHESCQIVLLSAPEVILDLLVIDNTLRIPLCSAPKHAFINKLLRCVDSRSIGLLLQGWDEMQRPAVLLQAAVSDGQLDNVHLALNLHAQLFRLEVMGEDVGDGARTKEILDILDRVVKSPATSEQFVRQIRGLQLTHAYRLFVILDETNIPILMQSEIATIRYQIMECIVAARAGLEDGAEVAPLPQNSVEWVLWEGMSDADVVRVGVDRLSAVHCFLAVRRGWTPEQLSGPQFKELVVSSAVHLIEKSDLEGAKRLISHTGFNKREEVKNICVNSTNRDLRFFIIENWEGILNENEVNGCEFLTLIEDVLKRHMTSYNFEAEGISSLNNMQLSISSVTLLTDGMKQDIVTELFFKTWDTCMLERLESVSCWKFLIKSNCIEGLKLWIKNDISAHDRLPWSSGVIEKFNEWPITQEMIDWISVAKCTDSTKEILFDWLSLEGLFSTDCKKNPQQILKQLGRTKSIIEVENILNEQLTKDLLTFASSRNLIDLVIMSNDQIPNFLPVESSESECTDNHEVKWIDLWKAFIELEDDWGEEKVLSVIQKTAEYLSHGNMETYKKDHPLISIALTLLQNKSLLDISDPLSVSPLLAISLPFQGEDRRETTLYSLLSGTTAFQTDLLFQWQTGQKRCASKEVKTQFPHFGCDRLSTLFGHKQCLQYVDHLQHARPSFAFVQFFNEYSSAQGKIPVRMQKRGANVAHGLALQLLTDRAVGSACVAFIEMLARNSYPLRVHLACLNAIQKSSVNCDENDLKRIVQGIVSNHQAPAEQLMDILQSAILPSLENLCSDDIIHCLKMWHLPTKLAKQHHLPLPELFPKFLAKENNWLLFCIIMHFFDYPKSQVMNLLRNFESQTLAEHFWYALQLGVDNEGHVTSKTDNSVTEFNSSQTLFVSSAKHGNSMKELLKQARVQHSPGLALLATYYESKHVMSCFCEWLAASLPVEYEASLPVGTLDWTCELVTNLLEQIVSLSFISTLQRGFCIFLPENPLCFFSEFLVNSIVHKKFSESFENIEAFKASCVMLSDNDERFEFSKEWVSKIVVRLCSIALTKCLSSYTQQHLFLQTIRNAGLQASLPIAVPEPDFQLLLALTECLMHEGLTLDYAGICVDKDQFQFDRQLQNLIESHKFNVAHSFASIAGLPHNLILIVEWKEKARYQQLEGKDINFWNDCDAAFMAGNLLPEDAVRFYSEQADYSIFPAERYRLLKYALKWAKRNSFSVNGRNQELNVLLRIYQLYLHEQFNIELIVEELTFKPIICFRKSIVDDETLQWFKERKPVKNLTQIELKRLDTVIGKLLDLGDLHTVWCLEAVYGFVNKDLLIIEGCLGLAEGEFLPENLPIEFHSLLSNGSASYSIHGLRTSNYRHARNQSMSSSCYSFLDDEQLSEEDVISMVCRFSEQITHGSRLTEYITAALRVAKQFYLQYKEIIEMSNPLSLMEQGCNSLHLAKDIITLACLQLDEVVIYLCSQLVRAITHSESQLFGCKDFADVLDLVDDPLRLGKLLTKAASLTPPEVINQRIELLILAHSCFTKACNMEGISEILKMCRKITYLLLKNGQWQLMARLLTGIGRYTEMRYIFHLLKDNEQFECLLSNAFSKFTGLKSATLDFARGDNKLFTLVALHFQMYAELASMFKESAVADLEKMECVVDGKIIRSEHNEKCLQSAVDNYSHAAQHYIQGSKLRNATATVNQAELVALQLSRLRTVEVGHLTDCLLGLTSNQAGQLIQNVLSYEDASIVCQSYDVVVDWSAALYKNFIIKGNQNYLSSWMKYHMLNNNVVQDIARRFQQDKTATIEMEKNMKQFVQMVSLSDLKYRVCSQLGFKDILQTLLSGPDLSYLKDTVWQSGFKRQHL